MLMNKNNIWKKMYFSPFASGLIDRCVMLTFCVYEDEVGNYRDGNHWNDRVSKDIRETFMLSKEILLTW